ncbi:single-stranded-DNA-specific exonuclease RecJ [Leeia sp. TBRC 13508]|uniref:Single-stranded-DNA-specific exonuclease RecJ n=1 Tax=Leeia speluncae TaxID=2884804 RepID=A0ABS8D1E0_9NEIS|nr:single-stranded-DNA-specific exonuclease RecJ [Leeia speluncae]MCB6182000.1 single-stranded-DNA-specific exonuclease RecJ [Leeia speluncae]
MVEVVDRVVDQSKVDSLVSQGIPSAFARLLAARGVSQRSEIEYSLQGLPSFESMKGIQSAASQLTDAILNKKRLLIIADYDADGATACAVAVRGLRMLGGLVEFIVPNRFEYGYGLSPDIVELARERQPDFLITVDNGIASIDGIRLANQYGIGVIVTDHHLPGDELPDALAIVNPNQPGCDFPSKALAGVGVMFYVLLATRAEMRRRGCYEQQPQPNLASLLDLVALGTVADVVPLDALNRTLVHQGLQRIRAGQACAGLNALMQVAVKGHQQAGCYDLGFVLGPRLNAAGRLEDMSLGIQLLLTDTSSVAMDLAAELDELNKARREIEADMQQEALSLLSMKVEDDRYSLVLFEKDWHQGVIGLVAGKLKEKFHRPAIVFARGNDGELKGSGRSIPGFHLRDALDLVSKQYPGLILKFGGHAAAAGLTIDEQHLDTFMNAFEHVAQTWLTPKQLKKLVETDGELTIPEFDLALADQLANAVWGQAFPQPVFRGDFFVSDQRIVGERHLKLRLVPKGGLIEIDGILFNQPDFLPEEVSLVYRLEVNRFRGKTQLQISVQHWAGKL